MIGAFRLKKKKMICPLGLSAFLEHAFSKLPPQFVKTSNTQTDIWKHKTK